MNDITNNHHGNDHRCYNNHFKGLSDLSALVISGFVLFSQKTVYLNIEELDSAPQLLILPFYRPQFWLNPYDKRHRELVSDTKKRIEDKGEKVGQQESFLRIEEDRINLDNIKGMKDNH